MACRVAKIVAVALVAFAATTQATEPVVPRAWPPPVEDFFRKPQYGGAVLSPNGRYLAVIAVSASSIWKRASRCRR